MTEAGYAKGLEGVIAAESTICRVDGQEGRLYYRGYSIEDLTKHSTYEETTYLLLNEKLPTAGELADFSARMRASRHVAVAVQDMIRGFPRQGKPMELLQAVISYLSGTVEHQIEHSATCNCRRTVHQIAQMATVLAAYDRFRRGESYIAPREDLSQGANFLYMLHGKEPDPRDGRIMDACLVMHAEHEFNASTFTARVVASTFATCYCSISAAIGALSGFLHGGADEKVLTMLDAIGGRENVESWLDKTLAGKEKVMGMGHRVYKTTDPRAIIMEGFLQELCARHGASASYEILKALESSFRARMAKEGKPIYPNVDFFSGSVYRLLGIPRDLFTCVFAMARSAGWLAHILEQRKDNRLFRPRSVYVGPAPRPYVPIKERT